MSRDFESTSSQYLNNANGIVSNFPLTMACWFKSENAAITQTLLSVGTAGSANHRHTLSAAGAVASDPITLLSQTTSGGTATSTTGYTVGTWHHAVGVVISATDRRAYIDGGSEGTSVTNLTPAGMNSTYIGARQAVAVTAFMDGFIAEAAIWNVALNIQEILALARGVCPLEIRPLALVSYWPVFGLSDPEPDYGGGGFHMTVNAAPPKANHAPVRPMFPLWTPNFEEVAAAPAAGWGMLLSGKRNRLVN